MSDMEDQTQKDEPDDGYLKLRRLLLGDDYSSAINRYISKEEDAERVARVLSEAITLSAKEDSRLGQALAPVVDKAIANSIEQNPKRITNIIFPIMGPIIRKAVASALAEMVQSLNTLLEQSLTLGSLNWRISAWRSGMPYAQYVLLQTIKYRVEQVLLVHRKTGLLLQSVTAPEVKTQDPELVSSMLIAITDFVSDSFSSGEETLDKVRVGELELLLFGGPHAILAVAVRGAASDEVREKANNALELIHARYGRLLAEFEGDREGFESTAPILSVCLLSQKISQDAKRKPWLALMLIATGIGLLVNHEFHRYRLNQSMDQIEQVVKQEPGYVVLNVNRHDKEIDIALLRGTKSRTTEQVSADFANQDTGLSVKLNAKIVHFGPIPKSKPQVDVESLINNLLQKGERSQISVIAQGDRLSLKGNLSKQSLQKIKQDKTLQAAFAQVDLTGLRVEKPLPVLTQVNQLVAIIQQTQFYFEPGESALGELELAKIPALVNQLKQLRQLSRKANLHQYQLMITGFADKSGSQYGKKSVSQQRAEMIKSLLIKNGIADNIIVAWGAGHLDRAYVAENVQRRVTIQVLFQ